MERPPDPGLRGYLRFVGSVDGRRLGLALALSIVSAVTESLGLLLLVPLLTTAGVAGDGSSGLPWLTDVLEGLGVPITFGWILVVYVVLVAVRAGVGWWRQIVAAELRHRVVDELRFELFGSLARARWGFHLRHRSSDLSHTLTSDVGRVSAGTTAFLDVLARMVATIGYLVVAVRLSAPVTGLAVVVVGLLLGVLWPVVRRARSLGSMQTLRGRDNFAVQQQFFDALKVVKSHGAEREHVSRYRRGVIELRQSVLANERLSARSSAALQVGMAGSIAVLAWLAVDVFETDGARLLVLVAVIARLAPMASTLLNRSQLVANMMPAYDSALGWMAQADEAVESDGPGSDVSGRRFSDRIELRRVSFGYQPEHSVLERFDLVIPCGATVGLVGPSGIGKTTVADLVLGLVDPDDGEVLVDGQPLERFGMAEWRSQVAYVPQETVLFNDTLRSNITWAAPDERVDEQRLSEVVDAASLSSVVTSLSDGLDTIVGDRGVRLSGGERQRVAIARALWREPSLLVLDEATSALDADNERAVQDAIDELHGSITMLVIAHRVSTLERAHQVVDLSGGS